MSEKRYTTRPARHGRGAGRFTREKPRDLVGTWKKLLKYCGKFKIKIIIALICAAIATMLTLAGPDRLKDMTNEVTKGVTPRTEKLTEVFEAMGAGTSGEMGQAQLTPESLELIPEGAIAQNLLDITVDGVSISAMDQESMIRVLASAQASGDSAATLSLLDKLPDSVQQLVKPSIDMNAVRNIALVLIGFYLMGLILHAAQSLIMAEVTQKTSRSFRRDISLKINRLPMWFYNKTTTGDVLSRVTNDVDTIGQSLNSSIGTLITAVIMLFGSLIMMLVTNAVMTATAIGASLIGFMIMSTIAGRSQKYFERQQKNLGVLNGHIEEMYSGHTVVKAYNAEDKTLATFDRMNGALKQSGFRAQSMAGLMMPIMGFIGNLGYVAVCVVGGALAMKNKIDFGVIVAFMMYVRYFTQPLSQIAQSVQSLQSAAAAGERVFDFLEAEEMPAEEGKLSDMGSVKGEVRFDHVRFGYEDSDKIVIHDFSAVAKPGQKVAIVGPTGAGKTTMVNLLMRFHELKDGHILIDGVPTSDIRREAVHEQFCMVLQDTWLFEGTVRENLVYNTPNVSEEQIKSACRAVGLHHFIKTLPQGYDTVLSDSVSLSAGQKQQLTIARAMIADKPMLILDEATSSVDTRTEQRIQSAMDKLMENRTSFIIAHRLSTIRDADLILVMNHGDIVESGTHEAILAKNGFYAELYNSQFEEAG